MRFLFSFLSMLSLAVTFILGVVDATRMVATNTLAFTPLGASIQSAFPGMMDPVQSFFEQYGVTFLWDPVALTILALPGWLVFAVISLIFYGIGFKFRKRKPFAHSFR